MLHRRLISSDSDETNSCGRLCGNLCSSRYLRGRICRLGSCRLDGLRHQRPCRRAAGPGGLLAGARLFHRFSYALAAAFATWALSRTILFRQGRIVSAGAAAGGVTLLGALMAGGCFLIGCCGSPMLAVYLSLFGAKALGLGKPLMALVTLVSVSCGYWYFSRRLARGSTCMDDCCSRSDTSTGVENINRFK